VSPVHKESMAVELGKRLRELRADHGYTVRELADLADVCESDVAKSENGLILPSLVVLVKIAVALDTTVGRIVDGEREAGEAS
jgi:transcriptional regulator with XRE-family HTH domain